MSQADVLKWLKKNKKGTTKEIAAGTGRGVTTVSTTLDKLSYSGEVDYQIIEKSTYPFYKYRIWRLKEK